MENIRTVIGLLALTVFAFNVSGCMSKNERLERKIKKAGIEEISPNLYKGVTKNFISNNIALKTSIKIATKHCKDKGLERYIQQRKIVDDMVHFTWACLSEKDASDVAIKYKNIADELIQRNTGIRKVGKYTYNIVIKKTRIYTENLAAVYCSNSPLNKNLIMMPQFQYGAQLTFACVAYDDKSPEILELRDKAEKYKENILKRDRLIAEKKALEAERREAKRHARQMEKLEKEKIMLQEQQLYQSRQPQYAPAIKTKCERNYLGQPECISYDSRDYLAPYR